MQTGFEHFIAHLQRRHLASHTLQRAAETAVTRQNREASVSDLPTNDNND